jgi:hypothetical protein
MTRRQRRAAARRIRPHARIFTPGVELRRQCATFDAENGCGPFDHLRGDRSRIPGSGYESIGLMQGLRLIEQGHDKVSRLVRRIGAASAPL